MPFHTPTTPVLSIHDLLKLEKRSARDAAGLFVLEGRKIIAEAVAAKFAIRQIVLTEKFWQQQRKFVEELHAPEIPILHISEQHLLRLSSTTTPSGILAVAQLPQTNLQDLMNGQVVLACEDVRDPGNLGTILRTADWFGVSHILLSRNGVDPYNEKVIRATMGSLFHQKIVVSTQFVDDCLALKAAGFALVVSRPEARQNYSPTRESKMCLVLGNESNGTSADIDAAADAFYTIPKFGAAESLNVAVSFGIMMSDLAPKLFPPAKSL